MNKWMGDGWMDVEGEGTKRGNKREREEEGQRKENRKAEYRGEG